MIRERAVGRRVLQQRADHASAERERGGIRHHDLHAACLGACAHDRDRLGVTGAVDEIDTRTVAGRDRVGQMHRLRRGGAFVEQGGVRDLQPRQVRHHRLEVEQRLEPALSDLRLVRRVGRVPAGVLQHVPQDDRRRDTVVVAHPQVRAEHLVLGGEAAQLGERFLLGAGGRQVERAPQANVGGHDRIHEIGERAVAQRVQHRPDVVRPGTEVPRSEHIGVREG